MPLLRSARSVAQIPAVRTQQKRHFVATTVRRAGDHSHGDQYDPPSGWLFNVKPGQKYENEGWESVFYIGFFGSLLVGVIGYCYKPDTSIQTWALEEARRRLEAKGLIEDSEKH
ncbi:hypothetical protein K470DRAFT_218916 [Piedraia hortae CBS 480.64]|uniref:NADH dehydrogenase [ubiquinone] 1 beta subcomplex subunit 11, mitochondrial n=1 Tax=Piedraia hortae CBS 480.64 TaxID=1314780 RepID=A0A6A7BW01_9PEZI|nr:hypothetical protein K470DRAFT_218916 [Piedraia hortae CBS 480.64]